MKQTNNQIYATVQLRAMANLAPFHSNAAFAATRSRKSLHDHSERSPLMSDRRR